MKLIVDSKEEAVKVKNNLMRTMVELDTKHSIHPTIAHNILSTLTHIRDNIEVSTDEQKFYINAWCETEMNEGKDSLQSIYVVESKPTPNRRINDPKTIYYVEQYDILKIRIPSLADHFGTTIFNTYDEAVKRAIELEESQVRWYDELEGEE